VLYSYKQKAKKQMTLRIFIVLGRKNSRIQSYNSIYKFIVKKNIFKKQKGDEVLFLAV
jgi:hypothetical protein